MFLGEKQTLSIVSVDVVTDYCTCSPDSPVAVAEAVTLSGSPMVSVPTVGRKGLWDLLPTGLFSGIQSGFADGALATLEKPGTK